MACLWTEPRFGCRAPILPDRPANDVMSTLDVVARRRAEHVRRRVTEDELSFSFARSGGPGGQNVNKVNTRATLWFDVRTGGSLSESERRTIRRKLAGRVSKAEMLHVTSRRFRTQAANRRAATERFYELVTEALRPSKTRKPTRVPRRAVERRLLDKRLTGQKKQHRSRRAVDHEQD